jgi:hypothetical protein
MTKLFFELSICISALPCKVSYFRFLTKHIKIILSLKMHRAFMQDILVSSFITKHIKIILVLSCINLQRITKFEQYRVYSFGIHREHTSCKRILC